jgi:hypothetical protein
MHRMSAFLRSVEDAVFFAAEETLTRISPPTGNSDLVGFSRCSF